MADRADDLKRDERVPSELLDDIARAGTENDIFDLLTAAAPPTARLIREQMRGRLIPILKERFRALGSAASASKTAEAWLTKPGSADSENTQGHEFVPQDTPLWDEPVDPGVLDEVVAVLERYSDQPEANLHAAALWVVRSHCHDLFGVSPILLLTSATHRCGKTSTLIPILRLVNRGMLSSNISPAALYRAVEAWRPALCIDEGDTFMKLNDDLKGLLNAGHTRDTAFILRCEGDNSELRMFSTWAPKVLAAIGRMPATVEDRSIRLVLRRKALEVGKEDAFEVDVVRAVCEPVRRRLARWVHDEGAAFSEVLPERPKGINDRAWNNWKPMFAIATIAGGEWPERARKAAIALSGGDEDEDTVTLAVRHIKAAFQDDDRLSTSELLKSLIERDDGPWAKWWADDVEHGRMKAPASRLAKILKPLDITPKQMWVDGQNQRGYERESFGSVWDVYAPGDWLTYAPASLDEETRTAPTPQENARNVRDARTLSRPGLRPSVPTVPSVFSEGPREGKNAPENGLSSHDSESGGEIQDAHQAAVDLVRAELGAEVVDDPRELERLDLARQADFVHAWNRRLDAKAEGLEASEPELSPAERMFRRHQAQVESSP
ncbi:MAG: DUF3631 domain-containing protein [Actinomycetota bacterium]